MRLNMEENKKENIVYLRPAVPVEEVEERRLSNKKKTIDTVLIFKLVAVIGVISILLYAYLNVGIFVTTNVVKVHTEEVNLNNRYELFGENILRYGKDGMAILNKSGVERWNAPYQISNPMVEMTGDSLIIADRNGNRIMIMDQDRVKGEIETTLPIEKVSVSSQGIVAALLKDGNRPQVICYDSVGNILAELVVSTTSIGHPLDIAISYDGTKIFATYVQYNEGMVNSTYRCYDLSSQESTSAEKILVENTLTGVVAPSTFFVNESSAAIITDSSLHVFQINSSNVESVDIPVEKEIGQVFNDENYIGIMLKGTTVDESNEIRIFNTKGKQVSTMFYTGEYTNIKIIDEQIILYDGSSCIIFKINGRELFEGDFDSELSAIIPIFGFNKYLVINKESIIEVKLKR